ncbi:hypothetical protein BOTBODRAFT_583541 [Botryobasidium botryosum FD-172 SS1]|uniref:Uncharacterized protein n=1 Tax=Botryobasidium botryosum (strain FD-172 SS1) TaxID=930990 RepID=A0A067N238_BOTB1|nr:hypothetical protein BOTBODRAFT_583541 [Botryobasidium botryosum FD-172 SS1]
MEAVAGFAHPEIRKLVLDVNEGENIKEAVGTIIERGRALSGRLERLMARIIWRWCAWRRVHGGARTMIGDSCGIDRGGTARSYPCGSIFVGSG